MDRAEVLGVLSVLKAAYPSFYRWMNRQDAESAVALWCDIFRDDNAATVGISVKEFINEDSKGFPPTPGQIRAKMPPSRRAITGKVNQKWAEYQRRHAELVERRRAAGFPGNFEEAEKAGLKYTEYMKLMDEAGFGTGEILEEIYGT